MRLKEHVNVLTVKIYWKKKMNKHYVPIPVFDTLSELTELNKLIYDADNPRQQIKRYFDQCFYKTQINLPPFSIKDFSNCTEISLQLSRM